MYGSALFALKNATFWSFWLRAGLAPAPAFHFLGMKHWFMRAQLFKSYKMTPL